MVLQTEHEYYCVPGGGTARQRVIESFESRADVERFFQAAADA